jgi:hypothetical protein
MKKGIWCELIELYTVDKEQPTKKFVGRKRQTAEDKSKKHYPITARGLRDPLGAGKLDGVLGGNEAVHRGLLHLLLGDGGAHPFGGRRLGHGVLVGQMLHAHPTQSALGGFAREEEIEEIGNGGGGGNELVNSTIPHYAIYIPSGRRIVG